MPSFEPSEGLKSPRNLKVISQRSCDSPSRLRYIGGPGGAPRKIDLKLAVKWPNIGHIRVHMRIYSPY